MKLSKLLKKIFFILLGSTALAVISAFLWVRFMGLPDEWDKRMHQELEARGVTLQSQHFYMDFFGRIFARNVDLIYTSKEGEHKVKVQRMRFDFNWHSWWRGESFLESARVTGAELN
ncbi:MAG: hypothetical protein AAF984_09820, partial [Verrucomicrobiota bacterium]